MEVNLYREIRAKIVAMGYGKEIDWAESVGEPGNAEDFATEYIFVVCNSGMKAQIARTIFQKIMAAIGKGEHPSTVFGHEGKSKAIWSVWQNRHDWFARYLAIHNEDGKVEFLETMPWIGGITKWHLAKNFGVNAVKPDRHLVRLGDMYCTTPDALCRALADVTGDRIGTVDYVLWRACNTGIIDSNKPLKGVGMKPQLKNVSVKISIACDDGYKSTMAIKSGAVTPDLAVDPKTAVLEAFTELTRLTALYGLETEALERFNSMRAAVAKDLAEPAEA